MSTEMAHERQQLRTGIVLYVLVGDLELLAVIMRPVLLLALSSAKWEQQYA
jgi:hypothetical protein